MLFDNFPLPLPWYKSVTHQDRFRQNVAVDTVITQLAPYDGLLPFQFRKPAEALYPTTWKIKCAANGKLADYMGGFSDPVILDITSFRFSALEVITRTDPVTGDDMDYFIFKNEKNSLNILAGLADGLQPGVYYMEMDFSGEFVEEGKTWCSETFRVPDDRFTWDIPDEGCNYPCFKWSHDSDIIPMHYDSGDINLFYNLLYLDTFITASEPVYIQKGENDGYDEFHANFHKLIIKYRLSCPVPDYIKVALYAMYLHENKYLFTENNLREGVIKNLEVAGTLSSDGALTFMELLFEQMSLQVKTSCEVNMLPPEGFEIIDTPALDTGFCEATGAVTVHITEDIPDDTFGELWGSTGGPYVLAIPFISRADLLAGWIGSVGPGTGFTSFKIKIRTFSFYVGESDVSIPVATC